MFANCFKPIDTPRIITSFDICICTASKSMTIILNVKPTDRIANVKQQIFEKYAIPTHRQQFTFSGITLRNGFTLESYNITHDCNIILEVVCDACR